jgi:hypothetical protein
MDQEKIFTTTKEPLIDYTWCKEIDRLLDWLKNKNSSSKAFCFDLLMSAAYLDATQNFESVLENCTSLQNGFNAHLGFINLCSPCYTLNKWQYQKALKPKSGLLGKITSELVLRFILKTYDNIQNVFVIGGTEYADALIKLKNGESILGEVKSAPLLTYPFIFKIPDICIKGHHKEVEISRSQFSECESGLYVHGLGIIPLGKPKEELWPFKGLVDFIIDENNNNLLQIFENQWIEARKVYKEKDRKNKIYYLTNACGQPPNIAKSEYKWPKSESISDGKTSAGLDRTDDIKKGIYQTLKIGSILEKNNLYKNYKTALISNLPAYRHGDDYINPFLDVLWAYSDNFIQSTDNEFLIKKSDLRRIVDLIITLENTVI